MKNLEKFGVQELSTKEMKDLSGGVVFAIFLFVAVVAGLIYGELTDK